MTTNNRNQASGNQNFKQIEGDGWVSTYLPAISAGTVMAVVLFLAISCSKKSDNVAKIKAPDAAVAATSAPSTTAAAVTPEPPKKVKKHRPANATYVNGAYGVSFSYPRKYSLQAGDGKSSLPVPASFVKPGAVQIASVDMPDSSFTDTDFSSGVLNVSVNQATTEAECAQFKSNSDPKSPEVKTDDNAAKTAGEVPKPETVKLGSNQFTVLEQMTGVMEHQSDMKYFHTYKNGACYEFALDVETSRKADEDLAQVDRGKVFQQLAKILTSARIKDVQLPGVEAAQKAPTASDAKPVASESTTADRKTMNDKATPGQTTPEKTAEAVTPQQK
jgi:hypothetical protein